MYKGKPIRVVSGVFVLMGNLLPVLCLSLLAFEFPKKEEIVGNKKKIIILGDILSVVLGVFLIMSDRSIFSGSIFLFLGLSSLISIRPHKAFEVNRQKVRAMSRGFLTTGSLFLLVSLYLLFYSGHPNVILGVVIAGIIAGVFVCIGFWHLIYNRNKHKNQQLLMSSGFCISAQLIEIVQCTNVKENGRSLNKIICAVKDPTGIDCIFESSNISINPEPFIPGDEKIKVYVTLDNYKKYYVDLSFIPERYIL